MLTRDWALGRGTIKKLVEQLCWIINTEREKINHKWIRALVETVANDAAVDDLSLMIQNFHSGFFARRSEKPKPRRGKKRKIFTSQQRLSSSAAGSSSQELDSDPNRSPPRQSGSSQYKRRRGRRSQAVV